MENFTKKYSLSKTLRFELKPVGKTLEKIKESNFLEKDEERAKEYKIVKKIIDEYHKYFIDLALNNIDISKEDIKELSRLYTDVKKNKEEKTKKDLFSKQKDLRRKIIDKVSKIENFKNLFSKELIKKDLISWLETKYTGEELENKLKSVKEFNDFTTYFTGFHENRKNIYTPEEKPTSIAYRIIHENFPRFLENHLKLEELYSKYPDLNFCEVEESFKSIMSDRKIKDFFNIENFNAFLNQSGVDDYNAVRGGRALETGEKIKGANEVINLFIQQKEHLLSKEANEERKRELKSEIKELKSYKLKELYKQILSDKTSSSFIMDKIETDSALVTSISDFYNHDVINYHDENTKENLDILSLLEKEIINDLSNSDLEKVYIKNDRSLTEISSRLFSDYSIISRSLDLYVELKIPAKNPESPSKKELEKWEKWKKKTKYFSVIDLDKSLENYFSKLDDSSKKISKKSKSYILDFLLNYCNLQNGESIFEKIKNKYSNVSDVFQKYQNIDDKELLKDRKSVEKIKDFLDSLLELVSILKPFYVSNQGNQEDNTSEVFEKDDSFYNNFDFAYERLNKIIFLYNKCRNYLTQKPYSTEKYKLNFDNSTLLDGWDKNKEKDNTSVLFEKNGLYYLGIMNKKHNRIFEKKSLESIIEKNIFRKMYYKQIADPSKDIQNLILINGNTVFKKGRKDKVTEKNQILEDLKNKYLPEVINNIRLKKSYSVSSEHFSSSDLYKFIEYYKDRLNDYYKDDFQFSFKPMYTNFKDFTDDVDSQAYKLWFEEISGEYINKMIDEGKLYLFQIYNKDFSEYSKGKPNIHTLYWKNLFDEKNLKDVVLKLNGRAEVFYRKASLFYNEEQWKKGWHYEELKDKFIKCGKYMPIIKDKRYAQDKFLFHVPITINFKYPKIESYVFNKQINKYLKENEDIHVLSIDRGERHLAYYTLLNKKGEIIEQNSFNIVENQHKDKKYKKDYHELLDKIEIKRDAARKNWDTIEQIKNIKEGYLSQIVHKIAQMIIKYKAIVVFEDLNFGFKKGRFKIEKQVYQKFEKMLIEKLNYLVFKDVSEEDPGGILNGYQLTAGFESFKSMGKQTGVIFYVPAYHTSKVCPATGFVNLLYPKYESLKQTKDFFEKFDLIKYNKAEDLFEFHFNYKNFINNLEEGMKKNWVVYSYGNRLINYRNDKGAWETKELDLTREIKSLFSKENINYEEDNNLIEKIIKAENKTFLEKFINLFKLTLQMRNSKTGSDEDYIISPVKDKNGLFFNSKMVNEKMPINADANGAYHIGLKGLIILDKIKKWDGSKKIDLSIKNTEWYSFIQNRNN